MRLMEDDSDDGRFMTVREEDLFDQGREQERDKWLPLWEAVKELGEYDDLTEPLLDGDEYERTDGVNAARYRLSVMMNELRNKGER